MDCADDSGDSGACVGFDGVDIGARDLSGAYGDTDEDWNGAPDDARDGDADYDGAHDDADFYVDGACADWKLKLARPWRESPCVVIGFQCPLR